MTERGRPKGKNSYTISICVTLDQFNFLQGQENQSVFVRGLLEADKARTAALDLSAEDTIVLAQENRLATLNAKNRQVITKMNRLFDDNMMHFKGHWEEDSNNGTQREYVIDQPLEPTDDDGRATKRLYDALDAEHETLAGEIGRVRAEIEALKRTKQLGTEPV
jgi:hypothetical protein